MALLPDLLEISSVALKEILDSIRTLGPKHTELLRVLSEEEGVYTNKGRLNKSALLRIMKIKQRELEDLLYDCQREFSK